MDTGILKEIIEVEKEIQQALDRKKESAGAWLELRKKEIQDELAQAEKELILTFQQSNEQAARESANKASRIVLQEEQRQIRLAQLTDAALSGIVATHIRKILPG
jgi:vacuolar-type H+-ATPase subunit H